MGAPSCNKLILPTPYSLPGTESMLCHSSGGSLQHPHKSGMKCQVKEKPCTLKLAQAGRAPILICSTQEVKYLQQRIFLSQSILSPGVTPIIPYCPVPQEKSTMNSTYWSQVWQVQPQRW